MTTFCSSLSLRQGAPCQWKLQKMNPLEQSCALNFPLAERQPDRIMLIAHKAGRWAVIPREKGNNSIFKSAQSRAECFPNTFFFFWLWLGFRHRRIRLVTESHSLILCYVSLTSLQKYCGEDKNMSKGVFLFLHNGLKMVLKCSENEKDPGKFLLLRQK